MEEWDLGPLAVRLRERLGVAAYAQAVWHGRQMRLLGPDCPGITGTEVRSSARIAAESRQRRPRPARKPPTGTA